MFGSRRISCAAPHPAGDVHVFGCADGGVMVMDERVPETVQSYWKAHEKSIEIVALSPGFGCFFENCCIFEKTEFVFN